MTGKNVSKFFELHFLSENDKKNLFDGTEKTEKWTFGTRDISSRNFMRSFYFPTFWQFPTFLTVHLWSPGLSIFSRMTVYFDQRPSTLAQKTVHYRSGPSCLAANFGSETGQFGSRPSTIGGTLHFRASVHFNPFEPSTLDLTSKCSLESSVQSATVKNYKLYISFSNGPLVISYYFSINSRLLIDGHSYR